MKKKFVFGVLLAAMLLTSIPVVPAIVDAQEEVIEQKLTFGPETLEELNNSPDVLATYEKIPTIENSRQKEEWLDILYDIGIGENK